MSGFPETGNVEIRILATRARESEPSCAEVIVLDHSDPNGLICHLLDLRRSVRNMSFRIDCDQGPMVFGSPPVDGGWCLTGDIHVAVSQDSSFEQPSTLAVGIIESFRGSEPSENPWTFSPITNLSDLVGEHILLRRRDVRILEGEEDPANSEFGRAVLSYQGSVYEVVEHRGYIRVWKIR